MGDKTDRIIGGFITIASASLGAAAVSLKPIPLWLPIALAGLGAAGGLVKVGWFGGSKNEV